MSALASVSVSAFLVMAAMVSGETVPADLPPDFVPLGAYLSWERTAANASHHGIDRWEDVAKRLDALEANHVNMLWVTNMAEGDLPRLMDECAKRGMRLMPSMGSIEARVDWRWADDGAYYDATVPRVVSLAGDSETLLGWVLSDEPQEEHLPRVEALRKRFREADPKRFCTAVTMWPQTPLVPGATDLPVVCVDLYPFFGPNDPNGPHTDAASKSLFRRNALKMIEAIGDEPAVGWIMFMCFSDIWGPRKYNEEGHLVGLPGAYLHWRAPTLAEMRWQIWESVRVGAKGFVCYTLAPEAPDPETATLPAADVEWKDVLAKEPADLGPNALTTPDGRVTPQLEEMGRVYANLAPHTGFIRRWKPVEATRIDVEAPGALQCFAEPESGGVYAVVLNDDLQNARDIVVRTGESVTGLNDLVRGGKIGLSSDFAGGSAAGTIRLQAGEGTVLRVETKRE